MLAAIWQHLFDLGKDLVHLFFSGALAVPQCELAVDQSAVCRHLERTGAALGGLRDDGNPAVELIID